jgi:hypothetical protein
MEPHEIAECAVARFRRGKLEGRARPRRPAKEPARLLATVGREAGQVGVETALEIRDRARAARAGRDRRAGRELRHERRSA